MFTDATTRRDLELFSTRDSGPGVFQSLDFTKTHGGRAALRARFEAPMSDPDLIRRVQEGVRFLHREGIRFQVDATLVREVAHYLDSSWDVGSRLRGARLVLESVVVSLRYRDLLKHARYGVRITHRLVSDLVPFLKDILKRDPPPEVRRPLDNLLALIDRVRLDRLQISRAPWSAFRADRFLRMERRADLERLFHLLSELDALISMAEAVEEKGLTFPEVVDGPEFVLQGEGLLHPFVREPVGNPIEVSGGTSLVFLTGPNMAGKTTYLKAVCISAYLAHLGMGVPAKRFRISVLDGMISSLSPEEDLRNGLSYFMAEVRRVREAAEVVAEGKRMLVVFDEVFRGTNVADARDASRLVMLGFAKSRTSGFIFSSHLAELAEDLRDEDRVCFTYFEGKIREGRATYDFQLREGVSDQRLGLQLLTEERIPQLLGALEA